MYTEEVMKHFSHPKNAGVIENADGVGEVGNAVCGDMMRLYIKVGENEKGEKIIRDIKFQTFGCVAAIASSSMLTELAKGKTLEDAMRLTKEDVLKALGGLPPVKVHCSLLAVDALHEAIYDYLSKHGMKIPEELRKAHERIERERKAVEEKYREFVKQQRKMFEGRNKD